MSKLQEHLKNLTAVKASLSTLSDTPLTGSDVSNLTKKVDALLTLLKQYATAEDSIRKEIDAIAAMEAKIKPKIDGLNTKRDGLKDGATANYNLAIPMSRTLSKTPAYSKANKALNDCISEMQGIKGFFSIKIKNDGAFEI